MAGRKAFKHSSGRCTDGFTFVEVLSVVAILLALSSLLFPIFSRVKERAIESHAGSNLRQLWVAMQLYREDYEGTGHYGKASEMGLQEALTFYYSDLVKLYSGTKGLWLSPCGQHPDTPTGAATNLSYAASDIDSEPWEVYTKTMQDRSILLGDSNCNPKQTPIGAPGRPTKHIGISLIGELRTLIVQDGDKGFIPWYREAN